MYWREKLPSFPMIEMIDVCWSPLDSFSILLKSPVAGKVNFWIDSESIGNRFEFMEIKEVLMSGKLVERYFNALQFSCSNSQSSVYCAREVGLFRTFQDQVEQLNVDQLN